MKPEMILQADMLDVLFEGRNKTYGAYELRSHYNKRMVKATGGMLAIVLLLIVLHYWKTGAASGEHAFSFVPPDSHFSEVEIIEKPKLPEQPKKPIATRQYTIPLIAAETEKTIPEIKELNEDVKIGTQTIVGDPASEAPVTPPAENNGNNVVAVSPEVPEPPVLIHAEVMPEFPGGEEAMKRFLIKNLRFDFDDMEPGSRIEIRCKFIVDKQGYVTGIEVIKSGGRSEFDKEVTRVVAKMPQWKPGFQKGKNVAVYFTLPVLVIVPEQ